MRKILVVAGLATVLAACATQPKVVDPKVQIENRTGKRIVQIMYRKCGLFTDEWSPLQDVALSHNEYVQIELPVDCADLQAVLAGGRVAGTQQGIKKQFPFKWVLE